MSRLLQRAVDELGKLPSIGERSALRLALYLLTKGNDDVERLATSLLEFKHNVKYCKYCNNISDEDICPICSDLSRDRDTICVVEGIKDVLSVEMTNQYRGVYFVLGGVISPMRGISPSSLKIDKLIANIEMWKSREVILALNSSMEGETTNFYIAKKLSDIDIKISNLARGIGFEDNLEQADELTLLHAINNRTLLK